jgi:hypothetical protein
MKRTFSDLNQKLESGDGLKKIPDSSGYYIVYMPEDFEIRLKPQTDAVESYVRRGKTVDLVYSLDVLKAKLEAEQSIPDEEYRNILYIGKAEGENGLRQRITQFVAYGYKNGNNHRGGRALWQIENNKSLLLDYFVCPNAGAWERDFLLNYETKFHTYPFANWQL